MPAFYVEMRNEDVGPFEDRDLAEMYAALELGEGWQDDAQVFTSDMPASGGFVALVGPRYESSQVAFWFVRACDMHRYMPTS